MGLQRLVRPECERENEKRFSFWLSGLKAPSGTWKRDVSALEQILVGSLQGFQIRSSAQCSTENAGVTYHAQGSP